MGDSHVQYASEMELANTLRTRSTDYHWTFRGRSGSRLHEAVDVVASLFATNSLPKNLKLVIIHSGHNDIGRLPKQGLGLHFRQQLERLLDLVAANNACLLWSDILPATTYRYLPTAPALQIRRYLNQWAHRLLPHSARDFIGSHPTVRFRDSTHLRYADYYVLLNSWATEAFNLFYPPKPI